MRQPIWILKDKSGKELWSTFERDYPTAAEEALRSLGFELVRGDTEHCPGCGLCNGQCICQRCDTCG